MRDLRHRLKIWEVMFDADRPSPAAQEQATFSEAEAERLLHDDVQRFGGSKREHQEVS